MTIEGCRLAKRRCCGFTGRQVAGVALARVSAHERSFVMGTSEKEEKPVVPPRIKAAFDFLNHARWMTEQLDVTIPRRELTPLEKSVQASALRAVQQYVLGE